ncbi:PREDICTED: uncharacterized protein LOC105992058 isoform X1 [Dipodomys ordii]|uniref:Uncharacterized protein LOC105992058 isoform X1 n=3 Tax=Dipodomys ordii TaxID=10020 RepID=A0A1S3FVB0_DIPOR|nr:PREDICTED: uncharacterized protein LOC105992058 isoform X1 [Dipodomys ordii]
MVLGFCCQREGLHRSLYLVHIFILAGAGYYYFQMYMGKPALDYENAEKSTQPRGETVRPVWGLMDKCYPVPAQASPQTTAPKEEEAQNDTTPQEDTDSVSQEEGQEKKMVQQEVAVHPSGKMADPMLLFYQDAFLRISETVSGQSPDLANFPDLGRRGRNTSPCRGNLPGLTPCVEATPPSWSPSNVSPSGPCCQGVLGAG